MPIIITKLFDNTVVAKGTRFRNKQEAEKILFDWYNNNNFKYMVADPLTNNYWSRKEIYTVYNK